MTATTTARGMSASELRGELQRLIEALDRRMPRPERIDEVRIAREAAELRERAVRLIREMERDTPPGR
ncbi:MAG TPA: hypothetical protein VLA20_12540 [Vicinamibacterales bacterium]|nr:hypothetical protein [Vicinamibacterales bacterium]